MRKTSRILALVLVVMTLFTFATMFTVSAAKTTVDTVIYLTPNANWKQSNARFALYTWDGGDQWFNMTDSDGDGIYECTIPAGIENIIFCRMDPGTTANNWNNKWNQTADLKYDGTNNHYTVKESTWDKGGGTWSLIEKGECIHAPTGEGTVVTPATCTTDGEVSHVCSKCGETYTATLLATGHAYDTKGVCSTCGVVATYTIAGTGAHLGTEWDTKNTANDMTYADGVYTKVYTNVAAGSYMFKCAQDHDWNVAYPSADKSYTVSTSGSTVTITLKGTTVTVDVALPHTHNFVEGKCECGEVDPDYVAPHVNALVVGETNKIVVSGNFVNDYNLPIEWVPFVADENAFYSFVGDNGALAFIFTAEGALVSATGAANLEAGAYLICLGNGLVGEFNVAVTKSAWVNALVEGDNKILITDAQDNGYGYYISWVPFEVTEKANYTFTGEGILALVYDAAYGAVSGTELDTGTYNICVAFLTPATTGVANVTVTKTAIGGGEVEPEDPALVLGDNTVVIDGTTTNFIGNAVAWYTFTPETAGTYTFACEDLTVYIYAEKNMGAKALGTGVAELEAGVTYYVLVGKDGVTGEFTVNVSAGGEVVPPNTMVVGDNHYVITDALAGIGFEFLEITITEPGTYIITGGAPMKVYFFTLPNTDLGTAGAGPNAWNVDAMEESGFASSFKVTLAEAGTYWMGFNYEYVGDVREFDINIALHAEHSFEEGKCTVCGEDDPNWVPPHEHEFVDGKCECGEEDPTWEPPVEDPKDPEPQPEPELNFFQKIIAWFMDLIQKLLAIFKK